MHALVCLAQQRFYLYMTNIYISESEHCWLAAVAALPTCIMVRTAADLHHVRRRPYDALDRRHSLRHVRPGRPTSLYLHVFPGHHGSLCSPCPNRWGSQAFAACGALRYVFQLASKPSCRCPANLSSWTSCSYIHLWQCMQTIHRFGKLLCLACRSTISCCLCRAEACKPRHAGLESHVRYGLWCFAYNQFHVLYGRFVQMISYRRTYPLAKHCSPPEPFALCYHLGLHVSYMNNNHQPAVSLHALRCCNLLTSLMTSYEVMHEFCGRFSLRKQIQQYYRNTPLTINNGSPPFLRSNSDLIRSTCVRFVIS